MLMWIQPRWKIYLVFGLFKHFFTFQVWYFNEKTKTWGVLGNCISNLDWVPKLTNLTQSQFILVLTNPRCTTLWEGIIQWQLLECLHVIVGRCNKEASTPFARSLEANVTDYLRLVTSWVEASYSDSLSVSLWTFCIVYFIQMPQTHCKIINLTKLFMDYDCQLE